MVLKIIHMSNKLLPRLVCVAVCMLTALAVLAADNVKDLQKKQKKLPIS